MDKERKKLHRWEQKNRWMMHYELKYGVQPIEFGTTQTMDGLPVVLKAKCRFCESFGREVLTPLPHDADGARTDGSDGPHASQQPPMKRRKKRQTLKIFGPNFRTDNLESHLSREHPTKWKEYERLREVDKKSFFPDTPEISTNLLGLQHHAPTTVSTNSSTTNGLLLSTQSPNNAATASALLMAGTMSALSGSLGAAAAAGLPATPASANHKLFPSTLALESPVVLKCMVASGIVELLEQLLATRPVKTHDTSLFVRYDDQDAPAAQHQQEETDDATSEFKPAGANLFALVVKHEALLLYVVEALLADSALRSIGPIVNATQRLLGSSSPFGTLVTTHDIGASVRQVAAVNLSTISMLLSYTWGFTLALHFHTTFSTGYVDVRLQLPVNDELHDVHIAAIPLDASKHGNAVAIESLGLLITKFLVALDARALEKVIGVVVHGDPFHMHKYTALPTWLKQHIGDCTNHSGAFTVLYSGLYHVSHMIQAFLNDLEGSFQFLTSLFQLEAAIHAAQAQDPDAAFHWMTTTSSQRRESAQWIHVLNLCETFAMHREAIVKSTGLSTCPSNQWWVLVFLLRDLLKDMYATYKKCQDHATSMADVQRHVRDLMFQLRVKLNMKSTDSGATTEFTYQDFVNAAIPLDLFMYEAFQLKSIDGVDDPERVEIFQQLKTAMTQLMEHLVVFTNVTLDKQPDDATVFSYALELPPSTPYELITINNLAFMELLNNHQFRIRSKWNGKVLAMITDDRNRIVAEFAQRGLLYESITASTKEPHCGSFQDAWKDASAEFSSLFSFAIGFGSLLYVPKQHQEPTIHDQQRSNLALEAALHAQQFYKVAALRRHFDSVV